MSKLQESETEARLIVYSLVSSEHSCQGFSTLEARAWDETEELEYMARCLKHVPGGGVRAWQ